MGGLDWSGRLLDSTNWRRGDLACRSAWLALATALFALCLLLTIDNGIQRLIESSRHLDSRVDYLRVRCEVIEVVGALRNVVPTMESGA